MTTLEDAIAQAEALGTANGQADMPTYVGDRPSRDWAQRVVDGDIDVEAPTTWYASDGAILQEIGYDPAWSGAGTVLDAYRYAYASALADAVCLECRTILGMDPETGDYYHPDMIGHVYATHGNAARVIGMSGSEDAVVIYVGDDREFTVPVESLTELDDDAYCHECGQLGSCFFAYTGQ